MKLQVQYKRTMHDIFFYLQKMSECQGYARKEVHQPFHKAGKYNFNFPASLQYEFIITIKYHKVINRIDDANNK